MSAGAVSVLTRGGTASDGAVAPLVVAAGSVVLLARPFAGGSAAGRTTLFAASYAAIAVASLAVGRRTAAAAAAPSPESALRAAPASIGIVLLVGLVAVAAAAAVTGPPVPASATSAALPLAVLAALAEEALFRRVAYARLERLGALAAVVGSAALFAFVHLPAYGTAALPVDLGAGLLFGWQRWACGSWTVPAATHAAANVLAAMR